MARNSNRLVPITDWLHIDPGKKRHKIEIQTQGATQDASGGPSLDWTMVRDCYAAIDTFTAGEKFQEGFVSEVVHKVYIDWKPITITSEMRVVVHPVWGAKASVFKIQAIENVQQRNLVMILTCLELDGEKVGS